MRNVEIVPHPMKNEIVKHILEKFNKYCAHLPEYLIRRIIEGCESKGKKS